MAQHGRNSVATRPTGGRWGAKKSGVPKPDYPHPASLEICYHQATYEGANEGEACADPFTTEMKIYLEMKGFPHKVHLVNPENPDKAKSLPEWFRRNNWDGVLPMAKYDKEQYKLSSAEIMMALEKKFRVPLMVSGGPGCGRFRGRTVKNLTLSLLKSVRPYDDTNPDWTDLLREFKQLNEYIVGCHGKEGDFLKTGKFSLWDIRMVPALYNLLTIANYFKKGFVFPNDQCPQLRSYLTHAFEDPIFVKFRPTIKQLVRYYEPKLNVRVVLPEEEA